MNTSQMMLLFRAMRGAFHQRFGREVRVSDPLLVTSPPMAPIVGVLPWVTVGQATAMSNADPSDSPERDDAIQSNGQFALLTPSEVAQQWTSFSPPPTQRSTQADSAEMAGIVTHAATQSPTSLSDCLVMFLTEIGSHWSALRQQAADQMPLFQGEPMVIIGAGQGIHMSKQGSQIAVRCKAGDWRFEAMIGFRSLTANHRRTDQKTTDHHATPLG